MFASPIISYIPNRSFFNLWRPQSDLFTIILTTFLITATIYQATAIIHDILLGTKRSGVSSLRAIHTYLLLIRRSPFAIIHTIFPRLIPLRERFTRIPALAETQHRHQRRVPFGIASTSSSFDPTLQQSLPLFTILRLLSVILAFPIISIASSILILETSHKLTFQSLNFKARAISPLDIPPRSPSIHKNLPCQKLPVDLLPDDRPLAHFHFCVTHQTSTIDNNDTALVITAASTAGDVSVLVELAGISARYTTTASIIVLHNNKPHSLRLPHALNNSNAQQLVSEGIDKLARICASDVATAVQVVDTQFKDEDLFGHLAVPFSNVDLIYAQRITCKREDTGTVSGIAEEIAGELSGKLTLVEMDGPLEAGVINPGDMNGNATQVGQFRVIENAPAVLRRTPIAGLLLLMFVCIATIAVRIIVFQITRNDVGIGIGLLIRDGLGLRCCDSMLPCDGLIAKYGDLFRQDPPEGYGPSSLSETLRSSLDVYQNDEDHYFDEEHSWNSDSEIDDVLYGGDGM